MKETTVERRLMSRIRLLGGMAVKLPPASHAGLPDRIVFMPNGKTYLVELKRPGGRVSPIQRVMHERLAGINHPVVILGSCEEVDAWVDSLGDFLCA